MAYISYDEGVYYFQGGLNGGRTKEYLELAEQCMIAVDIDVEKNNIAAVADESADADGTPFPSATYHYPGYGTCPSVSSAANFHCGLPTIT